MPDADVRHAVLGDFDALEDTIIGAFWDDPMITWMYPDVGTRREQGGAFMRLGLEIGLPCGHTYTAADNKAAAIWAPPDVDIFTDSASERLGALMQSQLGPRMEEVAGGLLNIAAAHPRDQPHFYLFVLGTAPDRQSRGLGSQLLHEVLDRCDRQGFPAYLESSNIRNVALYERHGFRVLSEIHCGGDFVARPMWREPQS